MAFLFRVEGHSSERATFRAVPVRCPKRRQGHWARVVLPYLQQIQENPGVKFDRQFLVPPLVVCVIAIVVIVILALLGPSIANIFSNIIENIGGGSTPM